MRQIEAEERAQWDQLFATTEEVEKAKANAARQVSEGPTRPEPVAPVNVQMNNALMAPIALDTSITWEQELSTLRQELEAHEALG